MKVLQVINSLHTGGAEKLILDSVPLYQKKGIEMDVLTLKKDKTSFWNSLKQQTKDKLIGLTAGSVYNPFLLFKIIPYLKQYDIIHAHLFPTLYWVVLAKVISGSQTPIIYTEHNTHNKRRNHFLLKRIDQFIYKKLFKIVTIAEEVDANLKKHISADSSKFTLIRNGVDVGSISKAIPAKKEDFFKCNKQIITQVSSFRAQKDQPTVIRMLQLLPAHFKLLLIGDGPLRKDCEELVSHLGLSHRVQFLGLRNDIPSILKMSDYILLSSHHEGLSLSSIEGMAAGKPFIASDVPGLREIVREHGLLFPEGDERKLAEIILRLADDPIEYSLVSNRGVHRAENFNIDKMISKYITLYQDVLKETKK